MLGTKTEGQDKTLRCQIDTDQIIRPIIYKQAGHTEDTDSREFKSWFVLDQTIPRGNTLFFINPRLIDFEYCEVITIAF